MGDLQRQQEIGKLIERLPKGSVLEREDWCEAAWSVHAYSNEFNEGDLKSTPLEALQSFFEKSPWLS